MPAQAKNIPLGTKLQNGFGKLINKKERSEATSSLKIEKLRSTTSKETLIWQPITEHVFSKKNI